MNEQPQNFTSTEVMQRYRFSSRGKFWEFVHKQAVPHMRISAHTILFPRAALEQWEAKRSVGIKANTLP